MTSEQYARAAAFLDEALTHGPDIDDAARLVWHCHDLLEALSKMSEYERDILAEAQNTVNGLGCHNLQTINQEECPEVTDAGVDAEVSAWEALERLFGGRDIET